MRKLWYLLAVPIGWVGYRLCWRAPIGGRRFMLGKWMIYHALMMCSYTVPPLPLTHPEDEYEKYVDRS